MCEVAGAFCEVGWCDTLDPRLGRGAPPTPDFEDERYEAWIVLVKCALLLLALHCYGGVGGGARVGADRAVAHNGGYADVDEILPVIDGGVNVESGMSGVALFVGVVKFGHALFALAEVSPFDKPCV